MRICLPPLLGVAMAIALALPASAGPAQSTSYSFYKISGKSAAAIYAAMISNGPRVRGAEAYAATTAETTQTGKLVQGSMCQVQNYRLKLDFVIRLPKLTGESAMAAGDRNRWRQFVAFLKRHEETHRSIWLDCAVRLERQVKALRIADCGAADRQAAKLWSATRAQCSARHDAFDAAEQKRIIRQPFVINALSNRSSATAAAAAQ